MSTIDLERVGESVVVKIEGWTLLLARDDAVQLGLALYKVAALGSDTLDEMPTSPPP